MNAADPNIEGDSTAPTAALIFLAVVFTVLVVSMVTTSVRGWLADRRHDRRKRAEVRDAVLWRIERDPGVGS
jgi:hypothetical protein